MSTSGNWPIWGATPKGNPSKNVQSEGLKEPKGFFGSSVALRIRKSRGSGKHRAPELETIAFKFRQELDRVFYQSEFFFPTEQEREEYHRRCVAGISQELRRRPDLDENAALRKLKLEYMDALLVAKSKQGRIHCIKLICASFHLSM